MKNLSQYIIGLRTDRLDEWSMDDLVRSVAELQKERDELRVLCAEVYQVVGALWEEGDTALSPVLDNLSNGASGRELYHATLLPFTPHRTLAEIQTKAVEGAMEYADGEGHEKPYKIAIQLYAEQLRNSGAPHDWEQDTCIKCGDKDYLSTDASCSEVKIRNGVDAGKGGE